MDPVTLALITVGVIAFVVLFLVPAPYALATFIVLLVFSTGALLDGLKAAIGLEWAFALLVAVIVLMNLPELLQRLRRMASSTR